MSKWISVNDSLPDSADIVIVCRSGGFHNIMTDEMQPSWAAFLTHKGEWYPLEEMDREYVPLAGITHWKPFPKGPKGPQNDN